METKVERLRIGPFRLVRPLDRGAMAERWMALNEHTESTHLAYRFRMGSGDRGEQRRLVAAVEAISQLHHGHLLRIEQFALNVGGGAWIVTPFTGNLDGLVTLESLATQKGGRMEAGEVERVLRQLLETLEFTHASGHAHGAIALNEVLVDPRGSVMIELYGLRRRMSATPGAPVDEVIKDEVRSIVEAGYRLLTGASADEPRIAAGRLVPRLDRRWDEWFDQGLDPLVGFGSADEAMAMLPSLRRELDVTVRMGPVGHVLERFKRALRTGQRSR